MVYGFVLIFTMNDGFTWNNAAVADGVGKSARVKVGSGASQNAPLKALPKAARQNVQHLLRQGGTLTALSNVALQNVALDNAVLKPKASSKRTSMT